MAMMWCEGFDHFGASDGLLDGIPLRASMLATKMEAARQEMRAQPTLPCVSTLRDHDGSVLGFAITLNGAERARFKDYVSVNGWLDLYWRNR